MSTRPSAMVTLITRACSEATSRGLPFERRSVEQGVDALLELRLRESDLLRRAQGQEARRA